MGLSTLTLLVMTLSALFRSLRRFSLLGSRMPCRLHLARLWRLSVEHRLLPLPADNGLKRLDAAKMPSHAVGPLVDAPGNMTVDGFVPVNGSGSGYGFGDNTGGATGYGFNTGNTTVYGFETKGGHEPYNGTVDGLAQSNENKTIDGGSAPKIDTDSGLGRRSLQCQSWRCGILCA